MHHIISDGVSMGILEQELMSLYNGKELPGLRLQYKDYSEWQQGEEAREKLSKARDFWLDKYRELPEVLNLPTDRVRPVVRSLSGDRLRFTLSKTETEALKQLAQEKNTTMFMLFLSIFNVLLSRLSNQQDIVVGTPTAGRFHEDLSGIVGMFVNTLPLRNYPSGEKRFAGFLQEVKNSTLASFDHQEYQYENLIDELQVARDTGRNPLFDVAYTYTSQEEIEGEQVAGLEQESFQGHESKNVKFDLSLFAEEKAGQVSIALSYTTDLFGQATIERYAGYLQAIITTIVKNPEVRLADINILSYKEQSLLLHEFNDSLRPYPMNQTVIDLFEQQALAQPESISVVHNGKEITYAVLDAWANGIANQLLKHAPEPKTHRVALFFDPSIDMIAVMLAVLKLGYTYIPVPPDSAVQRVQMMLEDCQPDLILYQEAMEDSYWEQFEGLPQKHLLSMKQVGNHLVDTKMKRSASSQPAYIIYTSGTAGKPKGVSVHHNGLTNMIHFFKELFPVGPNVKMSQVASPGFDAAAFEIWPCLAHGGCLYVAEKETRPDPVAMKEWLLDHQIEISFQPTPVAEYLFKEDWSDSASLKVMNVAGDRLNQLPPAHLPFEVYNLYGPTEDTVWTTWKKLSSGDDTQHYSIGKPIANKRVLILNSARKLQPVGVPGELCISGIGLAEGYVNDEALTAQKFIANPFEVGERLYKTGDLACWLPGGEIEFLGRADNQVKLRGFRIEIGEVEAQFLSHPALKAAAVVLKEDGKGEKFLAAFYATAEGLNEDILISFLKERLPHYMIPSSITRLDEVPKTQNGKVDRKALQAMEVELVTAIVAPTNETELKLAAIWSEILGIDPSGIGVDQNFFELGGHSLRATVAVNKIRKELEVEVSLRDFFKHTDIRSLARHVLQQDQLGETNIPKAVDKEHYVLSSAQKRQYFLQQFDLSSVTYNMPQVMRLKGTLDLDRLRVAFQSLLDRHESFRTSFVMLDEEPVQIIAKELTFNLEVYETNEEEANGIVRDFVRTFDLRQAPLLRAGVIRLSDEEYILMTDMHHIISDGVSMSILSEEFMKLYQGVALPELKLQYKDYSEWQQGEEAREKLSEARNFWLDTFEELPETLKLPTDHARPAVRSFAGSGVGFSISKTETEALRALAQDAGTTMFMTLLSVFNVLLSRLSNQQDIVIGTPTAGRFHDDLSGIVGMFVNTLPLRNYPSGEKSFASFLAEVKTATLGAFDHQEYQYENLIDELQLARDTGRNPLFDVLYSYRNIDEGEAVSVEDLQTESFDEQRGKKVKFDLSLSAGEGTDQVHLFLSYATDLYEHITIERYVQYFQQIVSAIAENSSVQLAGIEMLSTEEREELLLGLNDTHSAYPKTESLTTLFAKQVAKRPDQVAISFHDEQLTYHELNARANQLAQYLQAHKLPAESIVGIMLDRSFELIISIIGVLKAGYAYVPLDPAQPKARISQILTESESPLLLTNARGSEAFSEQISCLDVLGEKLKESPEAGFKSVTAADSIAYVLYTSGSTGKPKGVMVNHSSVVNLMYSYKAIYELEANERFLQFSSIIFDAAVEQVWLPLLTGNTLVLIDKDTMGDSELFNRYLTEQQVTNLHATPSFLEGIELKGTNSLRRVVAGGEVCSPGLATKFRSQYAFFNKYGPTETTISVTVYPDSDLRGATEKLPIGRPVANTQAYVLDNTGELLPKGAIGELYVSGDCLSLGYLNNEELSAELFIPNPYQGGVLMYRTGDLVRWLPDGNLDFIGRIDDQVKVRGYRIELGEVQANLNAHEAVHEAVVQVKGEEEDQYLVAYYTADVALESVDLKNYLSERLPDYMVPGYFLQLDKLPVKINGKLDKKALPDPEIGDTATYIAPANETEEQLQAIWATVLRLEPEAISITANFFELGGHSLRATVVVNKIRKSLQVEVSLRDFFRYTDIRSLASHVQSQDRLSHTSIPKAEDKEHYVLSSAQKRQYFLQAFDVDATTYNMPQVIKLSGDFDLDRLQAAFQCLVNRHESFRTRFVMQEEEPVQLIEKELDFKLKTFDTSDQQQAAEIVRDFVRPFDLTQAPLLRAGVIRLSDEEYVLMTDMHHIISDGVSMNILRDEFATLYDGGELPGLKLQYKDYSEWQQGSAARQKLAKSKSFWLDQFNELPETLDLPVDHARPAERNFAGNTAHFRISPEETEGLKALAKEAGTTMFMTLLSVFNVLLSRLSNQQDIVVGTPTAGRFHDDLSGIVGMFVNTLPLRNYPSGEKRFASFLQEVKNSTLASFDHQEYQYENLIDELQVARDTGRNPLFDVVYGYNIGEEGDQTAIGLDAKPISTKTATKAKFDLSLIATEQGKEVAVSVNYTTDLFGQETIERYAGYLQAIITAIVNNPEVRLADINILSYKEQSLLLHEFNDSLRPYPMNQTVIDLFEQQALAQPESISVVHNGKEITYAVLDAWANGIANQLWKHSPEPKTHRVALFFDPTIDMIAAMLAVLKLGYTYIPVPPDSAVQRVQMILEDCQPDLILYQEAMKDSYWEQFEGLPQKHLLSMKQVGNHLVDTKMKRSASSRPAYIIYTSGTTGKPKGVSVHHDGLTNMIHFFKELFPVGPNVKMSQVASPGFDAAAFEIWPCLAHGGCLYVAEKETRPDPVAMKEWLLDHQIEISFQPTPVAEYLFKEDWAGSASLKVMNVAGDRLNQLPPAQLPFEVYNLYGPTEDTVWTTWKKLSSGDDTDHYSIGKPIANKRVLILNSARKLQPVGVPGELCISGVGLAEGYVNDEALTAQKFIANPFEVGERLYKTGDLACWLPGGEIEFLGRADNQVKLRGFRIEIGEVEAQFLCHPALKAAAVILKEDGKGEKYLAAFYASAEGLDEDTLISFLKDRLPHYMVPSSLTRLDKIPKTQNGKVDRKALQAMEVELVTAIVAPGNETEVKLAAIWSAILGIDLAEIGIDQNFFELGGHSLRATVLVNRVKGAFGVDLGLLEVFKKPTIRDMALRIATTTQQTVVKNGMIILNGEPSAARQNLFFVHDGSGDVQGYIELAKILPHYNCWAIRSSLLESLAPQNIDCPEMAEHYVQLLTDTQSEGSYYLLGWSTGGVIAHEVASQLEARGRQVAGLFMIDTRPPIQSNDDHNDFDLNSELNWLSGLLNGSLNSLRKLATVEEVWQKVADFLDEDEHLADNARQLVPANYRGVIPHFDKLTAVELVRYINAIRTLKRSVDNYQPVRTIKAPIYYYQAADSRLKQGRLQGYFGVQPVLFEIPGNHFTMMTRPHIQTLGQEIENGINRTQNHEGL
ncbi:MAG: amino acid adenylation domain-containing protein, partial [Roseivirga sp.]|nr:amino acid adenylation domain-containing protein [Roseivirga sp.]